MKRLMISLALLLGVLALSCYGTGYVTSTYEDIVRELSRGEELMQSGEYEAAREHCSRAEKIYEDNEQYLAAFLNHGLLDDIGVSLAAVPPLANEESLPEFFSRCKEAEISLRHIRNDNKFLIGNLF